MSQEFGEFGTKVTKFIRSAVGFYTRKPVAVEADESKQMVYMDTADILKAIDVRALMLYKKTLALPNESSTLVLLKGSVSVNGSDFTIAADTIGFIGDDWYYLKAGTLSRTGSNVMTLAASSASETQETDLGFQEVELVNGASGSGVFDLSVGATDVLTSLIYSGKGVFYDTELTWDPNLEATSSTFSKQKDGGSFFLFDSRTGRFHCHFHFETNGTTRSSHGVRIALPTGYQLKTNNSTTRANCGGFISLQTGYAYTRVLIDGNLMVFGSPSTPGHFLIGGKGVSDVTTLEEAISDEFSSGTNVLIGDVFGEIEKV